MPFLVLLFVALEMLTAGYTAGEKSLKQIGIDIYRLRNTKKKARI
jgi:hypothetical protein